MGLFDSLFNFQPITEEKLKGLIGVREFDTETGEHRDFDSWKEYQVYLEGKLQGALEAAPPKRQKSCDVFLCHNSVDKPAVLAIGRKLKARGIRPWIDSEQITGGATYDDVIQQAVMESHSAAIFVGIKGLGDYQRYEMRAFLHVGMSKRFRVIPVLLPECKDLPKDEVFLQQHHYVKFSHIDDDKAIEALIRAIRVA
jgi:hypothetical protein